MRNSPLPTPTSLLAVAIEDSNLYLKMKLIKSIPWNPAIVRPRCRFRAFRCSETNFAGGSDEFPCRGRLNRNWKFVNRAEKSNRKKKERRENLNSVDSGSSAEYSLEHLMRHGVVSLYSRPPFLPSRSVGRSSLGRSFLSSVSQSRRSAASSRKRWCV